jgi:CDP-2,3-bis-(O-geranylgeranyl)-sn-glycerol synthase
METLWLAIRLLLLLGIANAAPIALEHWLGPRWNAPLDGGLRFIDGRPLLGPAKTWRGLAAAVAAGSVGAPLLGLPVWIGTLIGAAAMVGDALSSFIKRRLGIPSSGRATGLDQIPEALLPLLAVQQQLHLSLALIAGITLAFFALVIPLARWSYQHGLRTRPY